MPDIEQGMRTRIANFLPKALERALTSYKMIASANHPIDKETKDYDFVGAKKQQDACKVAIAHVELLLKLAHYAKLPDKKGKGNNDVTQDMLQTMLETAKTEVTTFNQTIVKIDE